MSRQSRGADPASNSHSRRVVIWIAALAGAVLLLLLLRPSHLSDTTRVERSAAAPTSGSRTNLSRFTRVSFIHRSPGATNGAAEALVARKLKGFVNRRAELSESIAQKQGTAIPPEVERFFRLAREGRWVEALEVYAKLYNGKREGDGLPDPTPYRQAILETVGAYESTRDWPAQALLDYGSAVLGTLPPGSIYFGGTDSGRFIPTLLNDDAGSSGSIILTQNALADQSYIEYLGLLYPGRLGDLGTDDVQKAFGEYAADAAARWNHDQQHPDEPKQVRPGEQIQIGEDGRHSFGGNVSVMDINERILQKLIAKNPGVPVYLEESFPFQNAYRQATANGPLLQLSGQDSGAEAAAASPESVAQTIDQWRNTTAQLLTDSETAGSQEVRSAYSKLLMAQAGIFEKGSMADAAEQAFRLAQELTPDNPETAFRYVNFLSQQRRQAEAIPWLETVVQRNPDNSGLRDLLEQLRTMPKK